MEPISRALSLDIILPTFNRSHLLRECLESVFRASRPSEMIWRVTVVDNNSSDDTKQVVEWFVEKYGGLIRYLFEEEQGRSAALNRGIAASDYLLMGFIDDDEQIDKGWLETVQRSYQERPDLDFIGGPSFGLWRAEKPSWLPSGYNGVLSADNPADVPEHPVPFSDPKSFLKGGNSVIRRSVFDRIGPYASHLGRVGNGFASCEDHELLLRVLDAGMHGLFVPGLIIHHVIPPERVTRSYYRKWAWGQAVSFSGVDRLRPQQVSYIARIPRYMIGEAVRGLPALIFGDQRQRFSEELRWWTLAGFVWGSCVKNAR
jgi:glycosyltransferase involved in cell wall biosynthesis